MASPIGNFPAVAATPIQSIKSKIVFLHDWWLVKSHHNRLAVGGFASKEECGLRGFCSAAISKRLYTNTLVTIDGITIVMSGCINKSKTHENGFSSKVCNHFLLGFPYYWETYGGRCFGEDSGHTAAPYETCIFDELKSCSKITSTLDDLPVTKVRDWFVSCAGDSNSRLLMESILDDVLRKTSEVTTNGGGDSNSGGLRVKVSGGGGLKMPVVEIEETEGRTGVDDGGSTAGGVVSKGMKRKAICIRRGVLRKTSEVTTNGGGDSNSGGLRVKASGGGGLKMPVVEIEETEGRTGVDDGGSTAGRVVLKGMKRKAISIRRGVLTRSMCTQIKEN